MGNGHIGSISVTNGWFDVSLKQQRMAELFEFFSKSKPNTLYKIKASNKPDAVDLLASIPVEIQPSVCVSLAIEERCPDRFVLLAGATPEISTLDRLSRRLMLPGLDFPNPKKFKPVPIGTLHIEGEDTQGAPAGFKNTRFNIQPHKIRDFIDNLELEVSVARSHETQRRIDVYGLRPITMAAVGIGTAALLYSCDSGKVSQNPPDRHPAISISIEGR